MIPKKKLFCFGYGYSCDYLARELLSREGWSVAGTTRDLVKRQSLRARDIEAHLFDEDHPLPDPGMVLGDVTHLLISTPPNDAGDPAFLAHAEDIARLKSLEWVGYLSTTGVYGDRGGEWVDETAIPNPSSQRGSRRLKAEDQWLSLYKTYGIPVHIFRLAGIYGPGRNALASLGAGLAQRIMKEGHVFGRIHVEDIANTLLASMDHPMSGEIFNVADDLPVPSHAVVEYACQLLGRAPPPMVNFEEADLAPITRSFYRDNRRTSNAKIKQMLDVKLRYPDYKSGLKACLETERNTEDSASKIPAVFSS